jgi:hypothetical protein
VGDRWRGGGGVVCCMRMVYLLSQVVGLVYLDSNYLQSTTWTCGFPSVRLQSMSMLSPNQMVSNPSVENPSHFCAN